MTSISDAQVEAGAKALWDLYQSHPYTQHGTNDLMFGGAWRGKIVPWEHLLEPTQVIASCAEGYRAQARACLEASEALRNTPEGWKLVPIEPTEEMAIVYLTYCLF